MHNFSNVNQKKFYIVTRAIVLANILSVILAMFLIMEALK
jgi:hypothetical protein